MLCQTCQCLTLIVSLIFSISYISPIWYRCIARCYNLQPGGIYFIYSTFVTYCTRMHSQYCYNWWVCTNLVCLVQAYIIMLSLLSHQRYISDICRYINIYINFILMSFYNMKNIAVKMLLIKLINQFSKLNRYYIIMYKQQRKNLLNSDRYFLIMI